MSKNWIDRVDGSAKTLTIVQSIMRNAGPGMEKLLWEHDVTFLELAPGVPFVALADEYFPEERDHQELTSMDATGYGAVEGFFNHQRRMVVLRNPSEYVTAHETGHAVDQALQWYGRDVLSGRDDYTRFDHVTGRWSPRLAREPLTRYAMSHPRERFAEAFAAYLDSEPGTFGRYHTDRLRATDRTAAALMRRIFREANGSRYEASVRPSW
jgi:hypothetical protein